MSSHRSQVQQLSRPGDVSSNGFVTKAPQDRSQQQLLSTFYRHAVFVLPLVFWMFSSSATIVVNKMLMVDYKFKYPMFLTAAGQAASGITGWLLSLTGLCPLSPAPSLHFFFSSIVPAAFCAALTLFLGNYAYLSLSLAFIQILKAFTPACTFFVAVALGLERLKPSLILSVFLIAIGTCLATIIESGTPAFAWVGFNAFMLSVLTEAVRVLVIQGLFGSVKYNSIDITVYLGPPTAAFLFVGSYIWERQGLVDNGFDVVASHAPLFLLAMLASFLVNVSTYWAIQSTSGLTLKVTGCLKNVVVVWIGVMQGDHLSLGECLGYVISTAGFIMFTYVQQPRKNAAAQKAKTS